MPETLFGQTFNNLYELGQAIATAQPPAPPPPQVVDNLVPLLPAGKFHEPPSQTHPYDLVKQSKLIPRAVSLNLPMVNAKDPNGLPLPIFAASKNGVPPTKVYEIPFFGARSFLYGEIPNFTNGRSDPINKEFGDDVDAAVTWQKIYPNIAGPRGVNRIDVYCNVESHPFVYDSTTTTDPTKIGTLIPRAPRLLIFWHNRNVGLAYPDGSVVDAGFFPGTKNVYQVRVAKNDRTTLWAVEVGGNVLKIDRAPGRGSMAGAENAARYVPTVAWPATFPTSIDTHTNGDVYYIDSGYVRLNGSRLVTVPGADSIVVDSPRNRFGVFYGTNTEYGLVCYNLQGVLQFRVIVQSGANLPPFGRNNFATIDVDENGTNGPAGTWRVSEVHTLGNSNLWEISPDGSTVKFCAQIYNTNPGGWQSVGDVRGLKEWWGHYGGWVNHFDRYQGLYWKGGYADNFITCLACDPPYPTSATYDQPGKPPGYQLDWNGKAALHRSGLTSIVSIGGWSPFAGCSFDELAEQPFDTIFAWLIGGGITETPRPELNGAPGLMAVCTICLNSQRALREGKTFTDACIAWAYSKGLTAADYSTITPGGHYVSPEPAAYYETDGQTIVATDQGRSTPIRYAWPPVNPSMIPDPLNPTKYIPRPVTGQTITVENGVAYCKPGPTRGRVL